MRLLPIARLLSSASFVLLPSAFLALGAPQQVNSGVVRRATVCNGHAELCERSFGSVSFVGAHDSYAIGKDNRKSTVLDPRGIQKH